jgi:hypothetical protein
MGTNWPDVFVVAWLCVMIVSLAYISYLCVKEGHYWLAFGLWILMGCIKVKTGG